MPDDNKIMNLFWVVGESSGDRHSALLIESLRHSASGWTHAGMCGSAMSGAGCEVVVDLSEASLMGLIEVIRHIPRMLRLRNRLVEEIRKRNPELVVLVDFPDFNLSLLSKLRKEFGNKIKILYFISPQVWAWRKNRAKRMAKMLDAMAVLFPFEVDLYKRHGLETVFFGHPFAGEVKPSENADALRKKFGTGSSQEIVTIMPGSRTDEIERHLPVQLQAVALLREKHPEIKALIVKANTVDNKLLEPYLADVKWAQIVDCMAIDALSICHVALIKSGTSTVEAAFSGIPFVVIYKVSGLTFWIAKRLVRGVKNIAMVNVLAGYEVVPERIQEQATPKQLAEDIERLWQGKRRDEAVKGLENVKDLLGEPGAMDRLAVWIVKKFGTAS
ncbi:MAG: lipid-A-disaccharide synthase [Candidatus Electryonea clarkiae]|nr:lipid-A-disaccharide synthase [Candidatus Electryonea clarkiae]MDP8289009.1 lipid-A-disaccharide synthase [Candidatus Electryonea clarkiae]